MRGSLQASQLGQPTESGCFPAATLLMGFRAEVHNDSDFKNNLRSIGHDGEPCLRDGDRVAEAESPA